MPVSKQSLSSIKKLKTRLRKIPILNTDSQEILRGRHEGETIFVHGNGPSNLAGANYAKQCFGNKLITIGMNASPKILAPNYYVLVDKMAMLRYAELIDTSQYRLLITQDALRLVNAKLKQQNPQLYSHIINICNDQSIICLRRNLPKKTISQNLTQLPASSANAGITSIHLALLMLLPTIDSSGKWQSDIKPGRLIIAGMDGYKPTLYNHHIDANSPPPSDAMDANLLQSNYMIQLFTLAKSCGIEIWNLNDPKVMPVNRLFRHKEFDQKYFP